MNKIGLIVLMLAGAAWALVGEMTGDWQLAVYTAVSVFVFGCILLWRTFRNAPFRTRQKPLYTAEIVETVRIASARVREVESLRADFVSGVESELKAPLSKLRASAKLLLDGAYGSLTPAAEEALRQIVEQAGTAAETAKTFVERHPFSADSMEAPAERPSIKNLKVG